MHKAQHGKRRVARAWTREAKYEKHKVANVWDARVE
jgi:hypothetical protein